MNNSYFQNTFKKSFIVLGAILLSSACLAGTRDGGGGVGVRCPGANGRTSFELLDISEARLNGLEFQYNPQSNDEISSLAAKLISNHFWNPWTTSMPDYYSKLKLDLFDRVLNRQGFMDPLKNKFISITFVDSLPLSNDFGEYRTLPGCNLEQIAYFDDAMSTIYFAEPRWKELDGLNRTALILHEIAYSEFRTDGLERAGDPTHASTTSENSRRFVSLLLSTNGLMSKTFGVPTSGYADCWNTNSIDSKAPLKDLTSFFIYNSSLSQVTMVMAMNNGFASDYSVRAILSGVQIQDFLDVKKTFHIKTSIELTGEKDAPKFNLEITKPLNESPVLLITSLFRHIELPIGDSQRIRCNLH